MQPSLPRASALRSALALILIAAPFSLASHAQSLPLEASSSNGPADSVSTSAAPTAEPLPSAPTPSMKRHARQTSLSLGVFGSLTAARNSGYTVGGGSNFFSEGASQSAAPSAGALLTFRQQFRPWLGYQVSSSYTRTAFTYTQGDSFGSGGYFNRGSIGTDIYELSSAWVVQGPHSSRVSTFADAGAGMLTFVPTHQLNDSYAFRATGIGGVGLDYRLSHHLALRAEYRGLFYKSPDFRIANSTIPVTTRYTLASRPTFSLVYNFGSTDQPSTPPTPTPQPSSKHGPETSVSLGTFANFTTSRNITDPYGIFTTLSTSPSAGVLGTIRQSFKPWLGYSLNMGYTRTTTHYTEGFPAIPSVGPDNFYINSNVYELSLTYIAQKHLTSRLTGFVDAGAGMLAYLPAKGNYPVDFRPEGVAGLGVDYHLTPALALRAEYRGQVFKYADYGFEPARHTTLASQPTLSLAYTFHAKKH